MRLSGYSGAGNLPLHIAERQKKSVSEKIYSEAAGLPSVDMKIIETPTPGQGTFVFLKAESENSVSGFTSIGERGKRAEAVGEEAAADFLRYYLSNAAFDSHLPNQIVLYLSMCKRESVFSTSCITQHLMTNLWVIGLFQKYIYSVEGDLGKAGMIKINGGQ